MAGREGAVRIFLRQVSRGFRVACALAYSATAIVFRRPPPGQALHALCRRLTRILAIEISVTGDVPAAGLIVSNHLGYVDILVLSAVAPVSFVSKKEVRSWPVFGWFARRTYTIFVDRGRRQGVGESVSEIEVALRAGRLVVLFPEGTSTGGASVLPFRSSLLASADTATPAALAYRINPVEGGAADRVCYWKNHSMGPHLVGLLGCRRIQAFVRFGQGLGPQSDRKKFTESLQIEVEGLHRQATAASQA